MDEKRRNYFVLGDRSSETQGTILFVPFDVGSSGCLLEGKSILGATDERNCFVPEVELTLQRSNFGVE